MSNIIPTIIITNPQTSDTATFERKLYENIEFIVNSNVILLYSVTTFQELLKSFSIDFSFRLLVHAGMSQDRISKTGESLKERLNRTQLISSNEIHYITRDREVNQYCKNNKCDFQIIDGERYYSFAKICGGGISDLSIINLKKLNVNETIIDSNSKEVKEDNIVDQKRVEFGIVTALTSEFKVFEKTMSGKSKSNKLLSSFSNIYSKDYDGIIALYHQFKMGNVDSSIETNNISQEFRKQLISIIPADEKYARELELANNINIHCDALACGPFVLKTKDFLEQKAKNMNVKIAGFEMESYGFARTIERSDNANQYFLIVKSVMDFTDEFKSDTADRKLEQISENVKEGDKVKELASYMSYLVTRALMPYLKEWYDQKK